MKRFSILGALVLFSILLNVSTFAQKSYVDPVEKRKRGLLEEPLQEETSVVSEKNKDTSDELKEPKHRLCECEKLSILATKATKRYHYEAREKESLKWDYSKWNRHDNERVKSEKLVKILRNKHDLEEFTCPYPEINLVKYKNLLKALKAQRPNCDLDSLL